MLVAGHPPPQPGEQSRRVLGSGQRGLPAGARREAACAAVSSPRPTTRRRSTSPSSTRRSCSRFFKSGEDPLDQHFGLDLPENVRTFRIVGIVRDAKFAGFALDQPARPMFYVALAQTVDYPNPLMKRIETATHPSCGLMLVTGAPTGTLEPLVTQSAVRGRPEPDRHRRAHAAGAGRRGRSTSRARWRASRACSASSRWCSRPSASTA